MPSGILSSNLITISSLDVILNSAAASDPMYRFQLISTKLAILTNRPSQPAYRSFDSELQILQCRIELARACLALIVPNLKTAEKEVKSVDSDCKGILKRMCRENRMRVDRAAIKAGADGQLGREIVGTGSEVVEGEGGESSTASRPAPTPISSNSTATTISTISTNSATSDSTTSSKYENRLRIITVLRIEAIRLLGHIYEMQGRAEDGERLNKLAARLEAGQPGWD